MLSLIFLGKYLSNENNNFKIKFCLKSVILVRLCKNFQYRP